MRSILFLIFIVFISQCWAQGKPVAPVTAPAADPLLTDKVSDQMQLEALWKKLGSTKDLTYLNKIIGTYIDFANDDRIDPDDLLYLSSEYLVGGPIVMTTAGTVHITTENNLIRSDIDAKNIIKKYSDKKALPELIIGSTALWSLGNNAQSSKWVEQGIRDYIKKSTNNKLNEALTKIIFRAQYPKIMRSADLLLFAVKDKEHALKVFKDVDMLNRPLNKDRIQLELYKNLHNEFSPIEDMKVAFMWTAQPNDVVKFEISIVSPDGMVVKKFTSEELSKNTENSIIMTIDTGGLTIPGVYQVVVNFKRNNNAVETLKYALLFSLL
jgi:hypothetical protein